MRWSNPSRIPTTSHPVFLASMVAAEITELIPGAGPPPHRMPSFIVLPHLTRPASALKDERSPADSEGTSFHVSARHAPQRLTRAEGRRVRPGNHAVGDCLRPVADCIRRIGGASAVEGQESGP